MNSWTLATFLLKKNQYIIVLMTPGFYKLKHNLTTFCIRVLTCVDNGDSIQLEVDYFSYHSGLPWGNIYWPRKYVVMTKKDVEVWEPFTPDHWTHFMGKLMAKTTKTSSDSIPKKKVIHDDLPF